MSLRAFLGVPVPPTPGVVGLLEVLRACRADLKVVRPEQAHLTLKFLGDVEPSLASRLVELMRAEPLPPPFEIHLRDVGAFPSWGRPSVFWTGVEDPGGGLSKLFVAAEKSWVGLGQASEGRAFVPHLTLARTRSPRGLPEVRSALQAHRGEAFGAVDVEKATLYESTLTPQGPIYRIVEEVRLPRA